jgi:Flp pilus assembly pilin Flp
VEYGLLPALIVVVIITAVTTLSANWNGKCNTVAVATQ